MLQIFDSIVAPLNQDFCIYFYILAILLFFSFILSIIQILFYIAKNKSITIQHAILPINAFVLYFVNRLLYNICINSISQKN